MLRHVDDNAKDELPCHDERKPTMRVQGCPCLYLSGLMGDDIVHQSKKTEARAVAPSCEQCENEDEEMCVVEVNLKFYVLRCAICRTVNIGAACERLDAAAMAHVEGSGAVAQVGGMRHGSI